MSSAGIPSRPTRTFRRVRRALARGTAGRAAATAAARLAGRPRHRVLLVTDNAAYTSDQQFAPMIRHARRIAARTGLVFTFMGPEEAERLAAAGLGGWHAVGLKLSFRTPAAEAVALAARLFGAARAAGARTVVFDGDDDLCVLWPGVLDEADAWVKKHVFSDRAEYGRVLVGKSNLTDHAHRTHGVDFSDDIIPRSGGLGEAQAAKIVLGWNIALDDKIADLARDIPDGAAQGPRDIDLLCRASVPPHVWTFGMRDAAVQAIAGLGDRWRIHAPTDRVPPAEYYAEMLRARISVSPFGYGELCWRDFESILCGSLLVKPDMSHVATLPDLFVPGETYVPVAWDYGDLGEACAPYLADEALRTRVAGAARARLLAALTPGAFLERFEQTMRGVGVLQSPVS